MKSFLDLISTPTCVRCKYIGSHVCQPCLSELEPIVRRDVKGLPRVEAASLYQGWLRNILIEYKSGNRTLATALAFVLVTKFDYLLTFPIVPMPSTQEKIRQRGFDTTGLLAVTITQLLGRKDLVRKTTRIRRPVVDQVGLSRNLRRQNVMKSLTSTQALTGNVILLDDVVTTGASLSELARTCWVAGANPISAVALCSAQLH